MLALWNSVSMLEEASVDGDLAGIGGLKGMPFGYAVHALQIFPR
jgi:hypothetical protein